MRKLKQSDINLRQQLMIALMQRSFFFCLLPLFLLNGLSAIAMVFLVGTGKIILSDKVVMTVLLETLAQAAAVFVMVAKYLFPSSRAHCESCERNTDPG